MKENIRILGWILRNIFTSWIMKAIGLVLIIFIAGWALLIPSLWVSQELYQHIPVIDKLVTAGGLPLSDFVDPSEVSDVMSTNYSKVFALSYSSFP